jgi:hypothetical protein
MKGFLVVNAVVATVLISYDDVEVAAEMTTRRRQL